MPRATRLTVFALLVGAVATGALACRDAGLAPRADGVRYCGSRPITLEVGQAAQPSSETQTRCEFAAVAGAEYVVAWLDVRSIEGARSGAEPSFEPYPLGISIAPEADPFGPDAVADAQLRAGTESRHAQDVMRPAQAGDGVLNARPRYRATPWTLDEEFLLEDDASGLARPARIVRLYDGYAAVARWTDATEDDDAFLAQLDTAYALVASAMPALWQATFVDAPLRSSQAGQYLIVLQRETPVQFRGLSDIGGDTVFSWMELYPFVETSALRLAGILAHEMTHHHQRQYMHATRQSPELPSVAGASFWAVEGGANLMSYEFVRRRAGVALDANHQWRGPAATPEMSSFQLRAQPASGTLTAGFDNAMGFLRDLILRRMGSGETVDDALRAVSRGAIEGWFGRDGISQRRGLSARMQDVFGARWNPADAVLDWTFSHAGDDLTPNPRYQDRASLRVWDLSGRSYGWFPDAVLSPSNQSYFLFKEHGSPGWYRVVGADAGFTAQVRAYEVPVRWRVLRIR
ncbi:MAG: hypothetical protein KF709_02230 [Gemmatimonadaceae bacterium]|nr:hypothetical protein [Gemmatimonadaceae bacterium]